MEENNLSQQDTKSKKVLSNKNKIFIMSILFLEIVLMFIIAYFFASSKLNGGWEVFGALPFAFLAGILSIIGIVFGLDFIICKKFSVFTVILIIFSIFTFPLVDTLFISRFIAPILTPMVQTR